MAHVVTSKCVGCKFTDCVEVCPVACFYELDGQVVIHAEDCIDCTACVAECPVEAIYAEADVPAEFQAFIRVQRAASRPVEGFRRAGNREEKRPAADRRGEESRIGLLNLAKRRRGHFAA